ncbi:hypothetical protein BDW75DRAFT_132411 [Aspergillus navahoensis]
MNGEVYFFLFSSLSLVLLFVAFYIYSPARPTPVAVQGSLTLTSDSVGHFYGMVRSPRETAARIWCFFPCLLESHHSSTYVAKAGLNVNVVISHRLSTASARSRLTADYSPAALFLCLSFTGSITSYLYCIYCKLTDWD